LRISHINLKFAKNIKKLNTYNIGYF